MSRYKDQNTAPGDRVRLLHTSDPYTTNRPGLEGTVTFVDDVGTVHVKWDNGSTLGLIPYEDGWTVTRKAR